MKAVIFSIILIILAGCGPSKRTLKTATTTTTQTETKKVDTSSVKAAWEDILNTVVNKIDMSKIRITTYFPTIDSGTGKQLVKSDVVIDQNVKTETRTKQEKSGTEVKNAGVSEDTKQKNKSREIGQETEKKTGIPIKYYLIGFAVLAGIGYLAYKFIRHQFF